MRSWLLFFGASSYGLTIPANEDSYTAPRNTLQEKLPIPKPTFAKPSHQAHTCGNRALHGITNG